MDISSTSAILQTQIANQAQMVGDAVAISTLKMAHDIQAHAAMSLLAALPDVEELAEVTEGLGQVVDVYA
jgi:hypothetical protein